MSLIEIKHRYTNEVLFSYECKNNTIKITLEKAVEQGADLRNSYLRGADLTGVYLRGADLTGVYLRGADLTGVYLTEKK